MNIDWSTIPKRYNYAFMDPNGTIMACIDRPVFLHEEANPGWYRGNGYHVVPSPKSLEPRACNLEHPNPEHPNPEQSLSALYKALSPESLVQRP